MCRQVPNPTLQRPQLLPVDVPIDTSRSQGYKPGPGSLVLPLQLPGARPRIANAAPWPLFHRPAFAPGAIGNDPELK